MKKIIIRVSTILLVILGFIGAIALSIHLINNQNVILKVQTVPQDTEIHGNKFPKSSKYYNISVNGHSKKTKLTPSFKKVRNQRIDVDTLIFATHEKGDNPPNLKIVKPIKLKDQFGKTVHDKNYLKLLKQIVKHVHYYPYTLRLFKTKKYYYAYYEVNEMLSDAGFLYQYNPRNNQFKKVCELDDVDVVKIQELK